MGSIHLTEWGENARAALGQVIARLKADDPLAPVTVVTPNFYSGLALRRVAAGLELRNGDSRGIANVSFTTLPRLAADLGAPALIEKGLRQITPERAAEAVRAALSRAIPSKDPLSPLVSNPSTEQAFSRVIAELEQVPEELIEALLESEKPLAGWSVAVLREYKKLTAGYYGSAEVAAAGAAVIKDNPDRLDAIGDVVLHCPIRVRVHEWQLIEALAPRLDAILAFTGEESPDTTSANLKTVLGELGLACTETELPTTAPGHATQILTAPDPEEEVRMVMREMVRSAERGERLYRKAVVYAVDDPYAQLITDLFNEAGIPFSGAVAETLSQSAPGRVLAGGLRLAQHDYDRGDLISWFSSGPVSDAKGSQRILARRWDHTSRNAGVIRGADEWADRLDALIARRTLEVEDEVNDARRRAKEIEIESARELKAFMADFASMSAIFAGGNVATWKEFSAAATELLNRYTGGDRTRSRWQGGDEGVHVRAYEQIRDSLESLASLADLRERVSSDVFVQATCDLLGAPAPHERRFGDGAFVGRIADAVAADFESIYVLGGREGVMPARRGENPLISDAERISAISEMPPWPKLLVTRSDQEAQARAEFVAAMRSASRDRVLCHPVGDLRTGQLLTPARWVIEEAQALARKRGDERRVTAEDLTGLDPAGPWHVRSVSLAADLGSSDFTPAAADEYELHRIMSTAGIGPLTLSAPQIESDPDLWRGMAAQVALRDETASVFSGQVGANPQFAPSQEHPVSPTALEAWAKCPYSYMLGKVLRLTVVEKPEAIEDISPLDRGSMIHSILDQFHTEFRGHKAGKPWTVKERRKLHSIANAEFAEWEARGVTGRALLWDITKSRTHRLLDQFIEADSRLREEYGTSTAESERSFGFPEATSLPPLELSAGGVTITIRGRIDRVDETSDSKLAIVIDYKTGSLSQETKELHRFELSKDTALPSLDELAAPQGGQRSGHKSGTVLGDPVGGGKLLQLPIYALGSGTSAKNILVLYWHFDRGANTSTCYGYVLSPDALSRLNDAVKTIMAGITSGTFPMNPGITATSLGNSNCDYCDFGTICPVDRSEIADRKTVAPEFAQYWSLAGVLDE